MLELLAVESGIGAGGSYHSDTRAARDEHRVLRSRQRLRRPLDHSQLTIGQMCQCRGIKSEEISPPPHPGRALLGQRGKPILPNNRPHELWRSTRERISGEKPQYITIVREQPLLSAD